MDNPSTFVPDHPQLQRTRKILLVILTVFLILSVIIWIFVISQLKITSRRETIEQGLIIGQALISILAYGYGLIAVYRYSKLGLRVFVYLYVIKLILQSIALLLVLILMITGRRSKFIAPESSISFTVIFFTIICIGVATVLILSIFIIKLTSKLTRFLHANQDLIMQQI